MGIDLKAHLSFLLFLEATFVLAVALYIFFAEKKRKIFLIIVPFFSLCFIDLLNIGILNRHTFLDSDLSIHKSFIDMLINNKIFYNDHVMQIFAKIYPHGYHYILLPFYRLGISVPSLSKFLGITLSLITPFLFYHLGLAIYRRKDIAFFSGIFAYIPSIWHTVYSGLPRSVGFVLFLLGLTFLFKYRNTNRLLYLISVYLIMSFLILIHPFSFIILFIVASILLILEFVLNLKIKDARALLNNVFKNVFIFLVIVIPFLTIYILGQKEFLEFTYRTSLKESAFSPRVSYAFLKIGDIVHSIGILPILLFVYAAFNFCLNKSRKEQNQRYLFSITLSLVIIFFAILYFDKLFFLKAHRFPPFISCFFYLFSLPKINRIYMLLEHRALFVIVTIFFTLMPAITFIDYFIKNTPTCPYGLHRQDPNITPTPDPIDFEEIYKVAIKIKKTVPEKEPIACALRFGDALRMYAMRSVTSSWKIGSMITTHYRIATIYREQILNSNLLYSDPLSLYNMYETKYFLVEKNKTGQIRDILKKLVLLFETKNFLFYKYSI